MNDDNVGKVIRLRPLAKWGCPPVGTCMILGLSRSCSVPRHSRIGRGREEKSSHYKLNVRLTSGIFDRPSSFSEVEEREESNKLLNKSIEQGLNLSGS